LAEIGARYITRTVAELEQLKAFADAAAAGSSEALQELGTLAHRIRGSGAMFGFHAISKSAESLELFAHDRSLTQTDVQTMQSLVNDLIEEVQRAARERGSA
jgi:HPt (histidine-containing phosphotransfer) domain-containing protein